VSSANSLLESTGSSVADVCAAMEQAERSKVRHATIEVAIAPPTRASREAKSGKACSEFIRRDAQVRSVLSCTHLYSSPMASQIRERRFEIAVTVERTQCDCNPVVRREEQQMLQWIQQVVLRSSTNWGNRQ